MSRILSLSLGVALLAAGCRPADPPALTESERAAVTDSVRALLDGLAAWMGGQRAGRDYTSFHDSAPGFVQAADGRIVALSFERFAERQRGWAPPPGARLTWDTLRVQPLTRGAAHFLGSFTESLTLPTGESYQERGVMSGIAVQRAGGWRIAAVHSSVAPPPRTSP